METIFVIGNASTRKNYDLTKLKGITIGCNVIVRDFIPDILCVQDKEFIEELLEINYEGIVVCKDSRIPASKKDIWFPRKGATYTGILALRVAIAEKPQRIIMLGFDDLASSTVYAGTRGYPNGSGNRGGARNASLLRSKEIAIGRAKGIIMLDIPKDADQWEDHDFVLNQS